MEFLSRNEKFLSKSSNNVIPIGSIILDLPPSCVEFVPPHRSLAWPLDNPCFVVGTYDLQKERNERLDDEETVSATPKEQSRHGSLSLFTLKNGKLSRIQEVLTQSAILDLHFLPESAIFAVVSSTGSVSFYKVEATELDTSEMGDRIIPIITHQIFNEDIIITSFAWEPAAVEDGARMVVTCNDGRVQVLKFNDTFLQFEILNDEQALCQHDYEAWCAVFSPSSEKILSGGDDSKLIVSQILHNPSTPLTIRGHDAGVTAILPLSSNTTLDDPLVVLTGSYDDHIRVITLPSLLSPRSKILAELDIGLGGGGVWKLKLLQKMSQHKEGKVTYHILACCMRVGAKILEIRRDDNGNWDIKVLAVVGVHESMCYASDVVPIVPGNSPLVEGSELGDRVVVSTSFYDRLLFVWRWDHSVAGGME